MKVAYRDRRTPDLAPIEVLLPATRDDAFDWYSDIVNLFQNDREAWKSAFRIATACDWYMLYLFTSAAQRVDPFTGRPEVDCDFQFNYAREKQFDGDGVADKTARGHWKSTWDILVGITNAVILDPESTHGIFSHERAASEKHGRRWKDEFTSNVEFRLAWDEVFWWDPANEAVLWAQEKGCTVKRKIVSATPTVSWYAIDMIPTGLRLSHFYLDDIENDETMATEESRKKTKDRAQAVFGLTGRAARTRVNFTHHHPAGWGAELIADGAYRARCHPAEDVTKPAPDIAALYDECGGLLPVVDASGNRSTIRLSPKVRDIRLEGEPTFFHPLECAKLRLEHGNAKYAMQYMGDPIAGENRRFDPDWITYYEPKPSEWALDSYLYITIDASKGVADPTFARVEATKADQSISWVGGLRRRLAPSEFGPAIFALCMEWVGIARIAQIRVEEYGQSTWGFLLRSYFNERNQFIAPIVTFSYPVDNRMREWAGLEPLYRMGRRLYPKSGIRAFNDDGRAFDLVDYYLRYEYGSFPLPITDDGLAADFLLAATRGKNEDGKSIDVALEFPESDEEFEIRSRGRGAARDRRDQRASDRTSWMVGGLED